MPSRCCAVAYSNQSCDASKRTLSQQQRVASKLTVHYTPEGPEGAAKAQWNSSTVSSVSRCCALRAGVETMAADALAQVCVCMYCSISFCRVKLLYIVHVQLVPRWHL
jgi:hypothetical protein